MSTSKVELNQCIVSYAAEMAGYKSGPNCGYTAPGICECEQKNRMNRDAIVGLIRVVRFVGLSSK